MNEASDIIHTGLGNFHPLIRQWFLESVGTPTDVQAAAWPVIAEGRHVLVTAPTGSGKTLTAFLWAINQLVTEAWPAGAVRVLYISPLKALNNDVRRNLIRPLEELHDVIRKAEEPFPDIRVLTRSGDTSQTDRRQMLRKPPEILITTPESLNILLSSQGGRSILTGIKTVILDEIHAVVDAKRGTYLITAVDRLVPLCGEFQRIALSATVKPLETVAQFVGGYRLSGPPEAPEFHARDVEIIHSDIQKEYAIRVRFPEESGEAAFDDAFWVPLVQEFKSIILKNKSTLLFVNSRRLAESLTLKINYGEEQPLAYAHHGSLSREIRLDVEQKLKSGELRAIVATNSLELGIDIGHLDEVILVQSPGSISSAIQRIGRAGHRVGEVSRGTIYPTHDQDYLEAAALAPEILGQNIESVLPIRCPLDVLAQVLVSMIGVETWQIDALYNQIRTSWSYRELGREPFDLVLAMLAGRYAESRIRELSPRIAIDRLAHTVEARKGALLAVYTGGGVIPDRGYFHLRHQESGAVIGELDEEFVWEARIGQSFTLGTQHWRIERITHNDVFVLPGDPKSLAAPFWKGEEINRDFHFSTRISEFLEEADSSLSDPAFAKRLETQHHLDPQAAGQILHYLKSQKEETGCGLPHRHHVVVEKVETGSGGAPGNQAVIHTCWGGAVNRPFALALDAAWEDRYGQRLEIFAGNDCIILLLPHDIGADELFSLVHSSRIEPLLKRRLEGSGYFGARFRECAGTALLLSRSRFNERMPLWMSRLHSQKLLETVMGYPDFPILLEAWRTCLQDHFDMDSLRLVLTELETGIIQVSEARTTHPSPMARNLAWRQVNQYMYETDGLSSDKTSRLRGDLLKDVVFSAELRPAIPPEIIRRFEEKRQRLSAGYAPSDSLELVEWVKERLLIPESEWERLLFAVRRDRTEEAETILQEAEPRLARLRPPNSESALILAREDAERIRLALYPDESEILFESLDGIPLTSMPQYDKSDDLDSDETASRLIFEWMRFYGPKSPEWIETALGVPHERLAFLLEDLTDSERIIRGLLIQNIDAETVCDAENFEILLRMRRAESVPQFSALAADYLPLFLAHYQGLGQAKADSRHLAQCLEQLACYPAAAALWASEILPARVPHVQPGWIDQAMQESGINWAGLPKEQILFAFETDMELIQDDGSDNDEDISPSEKRDELDALFPDAAARYPFTSLLAKSGFQPGDLIRSLWRAVWDGRVSNDTYGALHRGIETGFTAPDVAATDRRSISTFGGGRRARFGAWRQATTYPGNWFRLSQSISEDDPIEAEERRKDRVRILLDRYGILFRELLMRELEPFQWRSLFRTLRIMELSGEILSGYFFEGVPGPQFISHHAFRMLQRTLPEHQIYWMNALDPASLCGIPLDALKAFLPRRHESTHLVFRGKEVVLTSQKRGAELDIRLDVNDPVLPECLGVLTHLLTRSLKPLRRISMQTINGEEAPKSAYVDVLRTCFDVIVEPKAVILYRKRQ